MFSLASSLSVVIGTNIRDVIITVPAFFNQAQRRSVVRLVWFGFEIALRGSNNGLCL